MKKLLASALVVLTFGYCGAASADATTISISDGLFTTKIISDGGAGDSNALPDLVTYSGSVGGWTVNLTGTSDSTDQLLNLSLSVSSLLGGTLTVLVTDTAYAPTSTPVLAEISGTAPLLGSVKYETFQSATNTPFATSSLLTSQPYLTGSFSDSKSGSLVSGTTYSLTQKITITQVLGGSTSLDASLSTVSVPDGGSTALSLGIGLMSLLMLKRRFPSFQQ